MNALKPAVALVLVFAAGQTRQTFTGVITDSECSTADHSQMRMGPTDAGCVEACISEHGASYVLYDGKNVYALSDQKMATKFAAKKVRVTGTLDAKRKTIHVDAIALSPQA
jgi:hypothetical protein